MTARVSNLGKLIKRWYPLLVPVVLCVQGLEVLLRQNGNVNRIDFLLAAFAFACLIVWLIHAISARISTDPQKVIFLTFALTLIIFFYQLIGKVYDRTVEVATRIFALDFSIHPVVFPILVTGFIIGFTFLIRKSKKDFAPVNLYFLYASAAFLAIQAYYVTNRMLNKPMIGIKEAPVLSAAKLQRAQLDSVPDIYYLIIDAYTSSESLKKYASFHNDLDTLLQEKGFYIAEKSRSNYPLTYPSLASSLNLSYLTSETDQVGFEGQEKLKGFIRNNIVSEFLRSLGYQEIYLSHVFEKAEVKVLEDKPEALFYTAIFRRAAFYPFVQRSVENWILHKHLRSSEKILNPLGYSYYQYNQFVYNGLINAVQSPAQRKIVYAHFMNTHAPFVSDSAGHYNNAAFFPPSVKDYLVQIGDLNKKLMTAVDLIQKDGKRKIIIIQADHGSHLFGLKEIFDIQNAYYFSGEDYRGLYSSISPVNTFRVILSRYFNQDLTKLPDSEFYLSY